MDTDRPSSGGPSSARPSLEGLPTHIRLVEPIGAGTSATVWRARDTHNGRDLAVKVIEPVPGVDPVLRSDRLERECRALARLNHVEGIVGLHELGTTADGTSWIVMDLAANGSLRDRLVATSLGQHSPGQASPAGRHSMSLPDARSLGARLGTALAHAHALDVVHGDISPANVLLGERDAAMLVDFNMAAILGEGRGAHDPSGCTPAYAAPERLRGAPPDRASDVHALAATVAEVAAGQVADSGVPLAAELVAELAAAVAPTAAERPSAAEFAVLLGVPSTDLPGERGARRVFRRRR